MTAATTPLDIGALRLAPVDDSTAWQVTGRADEAVAASWGDWVWLARRVLETDALRRDLEARGDAWDQGHAAGAADAAGTVTANPFR